MSTFQDMIRDMLCANTPRYALFWIRDLLNQFVETSLTSRTTISGWSCCHWYSFIFQHLSSIVAWIVGVFNLITSIVMLNLITPLSPTIHAKMLGCANTLPQTMSGLETEFGSKVTECNLWHWFGEEVYYLLFSGDMLSDEKYKCNLFAHKMVIQFDVFATSMKHQIYCHVKSTCVITVESWCRCQQNVKIFKNKLHPCEFSCCICHGSIFHFSARSRDCMLFFCTPGDEISSNKRTISSDGSSCG